jgi:ribosomal protein S18 acetylase RimI-like enzyme
VIVCETQNTNVPAIRFYRALGFTVDGIDVSLYTNDDLARGEVALFLKKRLSESL